MKLNDEQFDQSLLVSKRKARKEFQVYLERIYRQNKYENNKRTDLDMAKEAYKYAEEQFYKMAKARNREDEIYDDSIMDHIMDFFYNGGTVQELFVEFLPAVSRTLNQPVVDSKDKPIKIT